jgi:preprotein translocase subunit SecF
MQLIKLVLPFCFIILFPVYVYAYVGPGLGAGTIGVILGILGSLFIALFAIIWYPLKRLLKKNKKPNCQQIDD